MKKQNHPLVLAQKEQAEFETTLPQGRFYSPDESEAIRQYQGAMAVLSMQGMSVQSSLPRAFVCVLAAANQFEIDLVDRLAVEVPESLSCTNFFTLSAAFAKGTRTGSRANHVEEFADKVFQDAALYMLSARPAFSKASPVNLTVNYDGHPLCARDAFKDAIAYTAQDILITAGLLNRPQVKRAFDIDKFNLLKETELLWSKLSL